MAVNHQTITMPRTESVDPRNAEFTHEEMRRAWEYIKIYPYKIRHNLVRSEDVPLLQRFLNLAFPERELNTVKSHVTKAEQCVVTPSDDVKPGTSYEYRNDVNRVNTYHTKSGQCISSPSDDIKPGTSNEFKNGVNRVKTYDTKAKQCVTSPSDDVKPGTSYEHRNDVNRVKTCDTKIEPCVAKLSDDVKPGTSNEFSYEGKWKGKKRSRNGESSSTSGDEDQPKSKRQRTYTKRSEKDGDNKNGKEVYTKIKIKNKGIVIEREEVEQRVSKYNKNMARSIITKKQPQTEEEVKQMEAKRLAVRISRARKSCAEEKVAEEVIKLQKKEDSYYESLEKLKSFLDILGSEIAKSNTTSYKEWEELINYVESVPTRDESEESED